MAAHGLEIGSLDVVTDMAADEGYKIRVLGRDATFGSAQAAVKEIVSNLADGDLATYDRSGNRVASFNLEITASDGLALALGEKALRAELYKPNTVTWTPPSDFAPVSVYEVITSEMSQSFDDLDEIRTRRIMRVTLTCSPFARSADLVTIEPLVAPPASETTATINSADSTTGWGATLNTGSGHTSPTVVDEGSAVSASGTGFSLTFALDLTATPVDMSLTPYLLMEMSGTVPAYFYYVTDGASAISALYPVLARASSAGTTLYALDVGTVTDVVSVGVVSISSPQTYAYRSLTVHDVSRSDTLPQVTPRQITRIIETGGTERTPASIHVETANGTDPIELAIVHTCPEDGSGYSPPLRRWRTAASTGPETASAITLSGSYEPIVTATGGFYAEVPTSALPEGGYSLVARMAMADVAGGVASIAWSTSTIFPDTTTQEGFTNGSTLFTFADDSYHLVPLAVLSLPSVRTSAGKVQIVIQIPDTLTTSVVLDEAWLFRIDDDCALSIVETGRPNLWLDSADVNSPVPTVWVGDDSTTRVHPSEGLIAQGTHVLSADGTAVFTAALTDYPATDATFYRRWHSNAAE